MKFVSNCSPLIFLAKLNFLNLLDKDEIWVPCEVKEELLSKECAEKDRLERFLQQKNVKVSPANKNYGLSKALGKGEMATIGLAIAKKIPSVLMDDRRARSLAQIRNLKPHGTLWLILRAHKSGILNKSQTRDLIYDLPSIGFRIDQEFLFNVLKDLQ